MTFRKAFHLAQSLESADRDAKALQATPPHVNVVTLSYHNRNTRNSRKPDRPCYRCGGPHFDRDCQFKDAECRNCGKKGHITRACRSKQPTQNFQSRQSRRQQRTNLLTEDSPEDANSDLDTDPVYSLFTLSNQSGRPLHVNVQLNHTPLSMEVDTGASVSVISRNTYDKLWMRAQAPPLEHSDV